MRDQILESFSHRNFSLIVVGNKYDLVTETNSHSQVFILYVIYWYFIHRYMFVAILKKIFHYPYLYK